MIGVPMKRKKSRAAKLIVAAIYPLVKLKRKAAAALKTAFLSISGKPRRGKPVSAGGVKPAAGSAVAGAAAKQVQRRYNPKPPFWKKKRLIIIAGASAALATAILAVSIPGAGADTYAAYGTPTASASVDTQSAGGSDAVPVIDDPAFSTDNPYSGGNIPNIQSTAQIETTPTDSTDPVYGTHDPRVMQMQLRLMELDYMDADEPSDYYGWGTKYSLQLFQRKNGLQVDGLAGQQTLSKLFSSDAMPYTVKLGDSGYDVQEIQQRLRELNYLKSKPTKKFGTETEAAVKSFQKANGLKPDGDVGAKTKEALFSDEAKPAPTPTPKKTPKPSSSATKKPSPAPTKTPDKTPGDPDKSSAQALIDFAKTKMGCKYVRGGKGPDTFDCSGFVYYCLNHSGYKIKYMTSRQWAKCDLPKVSSMSDMKPGDIICYSPNHVGIYIGGGQMIDASSSNGMVVQRSCDTSYWRSHFICARRVF